MTVSGQAGGSGGFLVAMIDGGGTVPPTLGVAAALVRRGHQVRVLADPTVEPAAALPVAPSRLGVRRLTSTRWPNRRP